ncbi:DUF2783 domain-containing protein [Acidovorax sp. sif1233]|jgi:hypothetical protein|uniref:DUF2783 domain-containing protein n=1 Tax=unclassified Acidovorax TaxID=2684926 RepID=UPI001C47A821|nr:MULTISPECIES: DUF2783 domain-containing protein [unclassified Acidovorax]MBV7428358.1 DUF2783 domain-containing protein [Acidovorax sp. sif0732]MBV7449614.1 DUF2783 domain-containing protein [Acidovorax sp. sif0715]MBV7456081.1 DUF2783 domain-containing protein [Acidovorax sp. sif1233]
MNLITTPNFEAADEFYESLIETHRELDLTQSHELNIKLVLLLANHVGKRDVLSAALTAARRNTCAEKP